MNEEYEICGIKIQNIDYETLLSEIDKAIGNKQQRVIAYANCHTINKVYNDTTLKAILNKFEYVHPDGAGMNFALRLLFRNKIKFRFVGSDFYSHLIQHLSKSKYKLFFFGHDDVTLKKVRSENKELNITGTVEGFNTPSGKVLEEINEKNPEVLIVGLGTPKQEEWISENRDKIKSNVILAVGDGIKIFSKTKIRGPEFMRAAGLEWLIRLAGNPGKYWYRYLIGNPLFMMRILKIKLNNTNG